MVAFFLGRVWWQRKWLSLVPSYILLPWHSSHKREHSCSAASWRKSQQRADLETSWHTLRWKWMLWLFGMRCLMHMYKKWRKNVISWDLVKATNSSHILDISMESQVILALLREVWVSEEVAAEKERCLWKRMSFFLALTQHRLA